MSPKKNKKKPTIFQTRLPKTPLRGPARWWRCCTPAGWRRGAPPGCRSGWLDLKENILEFINLFFAFFLWLPHQMQVWNVCVFISEEKGACPSNPSFFAKQLDLPWAKIHFVVKIFVILHTDASVQRLLVPSSRGGVGPWLRHDASHVGLGVLQGVSPKK